MDGKTELLKYLSERTELPLYDEIEITFEENYASKYRKPIWVRIDGWDYQVHKAKIKGGIDVMRPHIHAAGAPLGWKDIPMSTSIEKMFYKKHRTIKDFGVNVKIIPSSYKYCEGGGWTSMRDVYEIGNKQFADF